ncbi:MAG TPA: hypothetical protein VJ925_05880 [Longimicrobiales bacterium]|nr:hypothetical protein [Longimicrobiales bacterium]
MERLPPDATPAESLARDLLSAEGYTRDSVESVSDAGAAVLSRLFERLRPVIGAGGFEILLGRAAIVGARVHSELGNLPIPEVGPPSVEELGRVFEDPDGASGLEIATRLLADLLAFLGRLVGWGLTLVLLREVWPDVIASRDPADFDDSSSMPRYRGEES